MLTIKILSIPLLRMTLSSKLKTSRQVGKSRERSQKKGKALYFSTLRGTSFLPFEQQPPNSILHWALQSMSGSGLRPSALGKATEAGVWLGSVSAQGYTARQSENGVAFWLIKPETEKLRWGCGQRALNPYRGLLCLCRGGSRGRRSSVPFGKSKLTCLQTI